MKMKKCPVNKKLKFPTVVLIRNKAKYSQKNNAIFDKIANWGAKTPNLAFRTLDLVDWSDRFRGLCCSSTFRRQGDGAVTGSQSTDVLPGKAAGAPAEAPAEAPAGAPTEAPTGAPAGAPTEAPATNNIQKMPVKLCKLITQSHGNNWPSLRDLSGIVTSCVFLCNFCVFYQITYFWELRCDVFGLDIGWKRIVILEYHML